jgi:A/G-specific adenine glycosylase
MTQWIASEVAARQRALLGWYDTHGRDLPWRRDRSPYGTWISEVMLQQTTVATVIPRWKAFLERFPDLRSLAAASEAEVLATWAGLGYYRRARHLHQAARILADADAGLPEAQAGWRALPGVGDYASAAIASIGLGLPAAAVDANVRRVLARWACHSGDQALALTARGLQQLADEHLARHRPGDWNEALMDLGSEVCRAEQPRCEGCPVARWCAARQAGVMAAVPAPTVRREPLRGTLSALVLRSGSRVMLLPPAEATVTAVRGLGRPVRRGLGDLLAGTSCLPLTPWYAGAVESGQPFVLAWRRWLTGVGLGDADPRAVGTVRHVITHHRLLVHVVAVGVDRPTLEGLWVEALDPGARSTLVTRCLGRAGVVSVNQGAANDF